jgi:hypothetical protein
MTTGITRENLMMLVQQAPDELCTLLNNSSQLLSSLAKIRKICKENDVSFPPKKEKKKNTKKRGSTKPMNAYNAFLQECKKNPAVTDTVDFAERSAIQSKLWNEAKGQETELYQKCVKLAAADKLEKEKEGSSSNTDDESNAKAKKVSEKAKAKKVSEKAKAKKVSEKAKAKKVSEKAKAKKVSEKAKKVGVKEVSEKEVSEKEVVASDPNTLNEYICDSEFDSDSDDDDY